jgi:hypothetical protein
MVCRLRWTDHGVSLADHGPEAWVSRGVGEAALPWCLLLWTRGWTRTRLVQPGVDGAGPDVVGSRQPVALDGMPRNVSGRLGSRYACG